MFIISVKQIPVSDSSDPATDQHTNTLPLGLTCTVILDHSMCGYFKYSKMIKLRELKRLTFQIFTLTVQYT